jgi:hypothetical protein
MRIRSPAWSCGSCCRWLTPSSGSGWPQALGGDQITLGAQMRSGEFGRGFPPPSSSSCAGGKNRALWFRSGVACWMIVPCPPLVFSFCYQCSFRIKINKYGVLFSVRSLCYRVTAYRSFDQVITNTSWILWAIDAFFCSVPVLPCTVTGYGAS